ncbi:hypothetical protein Taro_029888 [Colocasia esculenta]|uniref:Uncharacterized protein n=1 Tax=Colocasia esculenta TaxID=4460 RepID=A0A843VK28_COLES|nr:hypothetical protein [Colocasia esculenta]
MAKSQVDLTFDQGIATRPMSPSGLLKATGPMSPSHAQNLKCPSREHKPQFVSLLGEGFSSGELRLGDSVGGLGGRPWCFFTRGITRLVGGGSWSVGARRWRVASLREGPLRLDLLLEVRLHSSSLRGVARRRAHSSRRL